MRVHAKKWGNSWAVRLNKQELDRLGFRMHDDKPFDIELTEPKATWDVSMLPVFGSGNDPMTFKQVREQAWRAMADERIARR